MKPQAMPWPKKCNRCACRRCEKVMKCDVGDNAPLHPCEVCVDKPYLTEGCTLQEAEGAANPAEVLDAFRRICISMPTPKSITATRRKKIRARGATLEEFEAVFTAAEASDFLSGRSGKWRANFDWILEQRNWQKVLEGAYPNETPIKAKRPNPLDFDQKRYTDAELSHLYVDLDSEDI